LFAACKGAVIVRDKRIISTGYNGTPKGTKNCIDGGCQRCADVDAGKIQSGKYDYDQNSKAECACCHGEENAIVHAAKHGISTDGATIYTTFTPCTWCAKMIINAGIIRVVAKEDYPTDLGTKLLREAGIELVNFKVVEKNA
jgi:dCMP deaminase